MPRIFIITLLLLVDLNATAKTLTAEDFFETEDNLSYALSPNGQKIAKAWRNGNINGLAIYDTTTTPFKLIASFEDKINKPHSVVWANNDRLLMKVSSPYNERAALKDLEKDPNVDIESKHARSFRLIAINSDGSNIKALRNTDSYLAHRLPNNDDFVLVRGWSKEKLAIFKTNIHTGKSKAIAKGNSKTIAIYVNKLGVPTVRIDSRSLRKKHFRVYTYQSGDWTFSADIKLNDDRPSDLTVDSLYGFSTEGALLYRYRNPTTGLFEIIKFDPSKPEQINVIASDPEFDIHALLFDKDEAIIGYTIAKDIFERKYFDQNFNDKLSGIEHLLEGVNYHIVSSNQNEDMFIIKAYGANLPGAYFLFNTNKKELSFIGHSHSNLIPAHLGTTGRVTINARDGLQIPTYIIFPPDYDNTKQYPTVIIPHGGPHARNYALYDNFAQFIATRGYIVLLPNFRGSTGYGLAYESAGYKQWGRAMQNDLNDTVKYSVEKGYTDPKLVCMVGNSYGGYAVLRALTKTNTFYRCGIAINPVTDLYEQYKFDKKRFKKESKILDFLDNSFGTPDNDMEYFKTSSPINNAEQLIGNLLLIAGSNDQVVPFKQSKRFSKALNKANISHQFIELEDTGHNVFYYKEDFERVYNSIENFLENNLATTH